MAGTVDTSNSAAGGFRQTFWLEGEIPARLVA